MSKTEYRYLGKYTPRKEAREIVTGKCIFIDDYNMPDMIHAKIMTSPYAHAMITKIDTRKAEALPGVYAVVTYKNLPEWAKEWLQGAPPCKPIVDRHLRYVGDAVAMVAADTEELCLEAIRLIDVEYEVLPFVTDIEKAMEDGAPQLYPEQFENNRCGLDLEFGDERLMHQVKRGNVDEGFEESDFIGGGVAAFENIPSPLAPEPPGMITYYNCDESKYHMIATTQSPRVCLKPPDVGRMPKDVSIECKTFNVGGSYGNKQCMTPMTMYTCCLARITGRPVKFMMNKEEQLLIHEMRIGSRMRIKFGMKNGVVNAVKGTWFVNPGILADAGYCLVGVGLGEMQLALGKCKNWDVETNLIVTNRIVGGTVRGFGGQELKSAMMPLVANAMRESNIDPIEFYKNNFVSAGDGYFWRDARWWICHDVDYRDAIDKAADAFGWSKRWKGWNKPSRVEGNKCYGVGASIHGNADVGEDNSEAIVRLKATGQVVLQCMITESGMGQRSNMAKVVAEELNVEYSKVSVSSPDSIENPEEFGLAGSRGTITVGNAVMRAAEEAKRQLFALAAPIFHCSPEQVRTEDGWLWAENRPDYKVPWCEAIHYGTSVNGYGKWMTSYTTPNFCINLVEVEVDTETGDVKLVDLCVGTDVGQMLDCRDVALQLHGSIGSAAVDTGLFEESILDDYTGRLMTGNLIDYKWRPFNEFPPIKTVVEESEFNVSKYHAIGIGEISGAAGASAIMMAISNAIGEEFCEYPATPAAILKKLKKA
jgi:CO/xanthine dehydrogenase Mo-binding subunit